MKKYIAIIIIGFIFVGCATKHYGRQGTLTIYEKDNLTCREIKLELAKVEGFIDYVSDKSTTIDGKEVLAFLGDFGIGNAIEAQAAQESATERIIELRKLQVLKDCEVSEYYKNKYSTIETRQEKIPTFNEEQAKNIFKKGNNTIKGTVYYGDRENGSYNSNTCAGFPVNLLPNTEYTKERFIFITGSEYEGSRLESEVPKLSKLNPLSRKYRKIVKCNYLGKFKFENISDGSYYLFTSFIKGSKYNQKKEKGIIMKKVFVSNGETINIKLTKK